jgi:hypothetical protein
MKKFSLFILFILLNHSYEVMAEPTYYKCSGLLHYANFDFDSPSKSIEKDYLNEVISMTIDNGKVRLDSGIGGVFFLHFVKKEFSICKTNEILFFDNFNNDDCKSFDANNSSQLYTEIYSGEFNRILNTLILSRVRKNYLNKDGNKQLSESITANGEFSCEKVKLLAY